MPQLSEKEHQRLDWDKGLIAAVVQHVKTQRVLMLGFMNEEALSLSELSGYVHFYSRSRQCLWKKGETSGNTLSIEKFELDCDGDTLLIFASPAGPTCHRGSNSCFDALPLSPIQQQKSSNLNFLQQLEKLIFSRQQNAATSSSYTARLLQQGCARIAQKVGEEGLEVALAAVQGQKEQVLEEGADLLYHFLVLLRKQELSLIEVVAVLEKRHQASS